MDTARPRLPVLPLLAGLLLGAATLGGALFVAGCGSGGSGGGDACPVDSPLTAVNVAGTFEYGQGLVGPYTLRGTISFTQSSADVNVTGTTYENANDRDLIGQGTLVGNRLDITLVPKNGDPDYSAEVTFLFGDGGATFCVAFTDTNNDAGPMGSYRGSRLLD